MTSREWLERGWDLNNEINALLTAQRKAFELARQRAENGRKRSEQYERYSREIDRRIDTLFSTQQEIVSAVCQVSDTSCRTLLVERYVNFKTWEAVAEVMHYSYKHVVHTLRPKAYKLVGEVIECNA